MKIILSRKGFDSQYGGTASPIMPDGSLVSLPVPSTANGSIRYDKLNAPSGTLGSLVADLTRGSHSARDTAHLDPDLRAQTLKDRAKGWRPIFGQAGIAQSHLAGTGVAPGDLFLFFGWFRRIEHIDGCYRFVPDAPNLHVIFGWLQIDEFFPARPSTRADAPAWAQYHTHFKNTWRSNTVYLARSKLKLSRLRRSFPGGGVFPKFENELCLTAPGQSRSVWQLPRCFAPTRDRSIFSYHHDVNRWTVGSNHCHLQTVAKGQEFVVDTVGCPGVMTWVRQLFTNAA